MTKKKTKEIQLPFGGFYYSMHSDQIEHEIESYFDPDGSGNPDIHEDFFWKFDRNHQIEIDYVKLYIDAFIEVFDDTTGICLDLEFVDMSSPKEYNFETDKIYCNISEKQIKEVFSKTDKLVLAETIKERHSSYDGFHSFYSNRIDEWFDGRKVTDFDHNELMTLLIACIKSHYQGNDYEWDIFYSIADGGGIGCIVYNHIADFLAEHPEYDTALFDADGNDKPQRCTETIEMELVK